MVPWTIFRSGVVELPRTRGWAALARATPTRRTPQTKETNCQSLKVKRKQRRGETNTISFHAKHAKQSSQSMSSQSSEYKQVQSVKGARTARGRYGSVRGRLVLTSASLSGLPACCANSGPEWFGCASQASRRERTIGPTPVASGTPDPRCGLGGRAACHAHVMCMCMWPCACMCETSLRASRRDLHLEEIPSRRESAKPTATHEADCTCTAARGRGRGGAGLVLGLSC